MTHYDALTGRALEEEKVKEDDVFSIIKNSSPPPFLCYPIKCLTFTCHTQ